MTDPTAVPPHLTVVSGSARLVDGLRATDDEGACLRLAVWLAEVSAEAARGAVTEVTTKTPPTEPTA